MRAALTHGQVRGTISKTVLAYADSCIGAAKVNEFAAPVAAKHGLALTQLREAETAMTYLVVEELYPRIITALDDEQAIYKAGMYSSNMQAIGVFLFGVVRLLGGTRFVYQKTAELAPRFANTGTMTCRDATDSSAILSFQMFPDLRCTIAGFDYRRGLLASAPIPFGGKRHAVVTALECQALGDKQDVYQCEW
jgi:hypothetical protein